MSKFYTIKKIEQEIESIKKEMAPYTNVAYFKKCVDNKEDFVLYFLRKTANLGKKIKQSRESIKNGDFDVYIQDPKSYDEKLKNLSYEQTNLSSAAILICEYERTLREGKDSDDFSYYLKTLLKMPTDESDLKQNVKKDNESELKQNNNKDLKQNSEKDKPAKTEENYNSIYKFNPDDINDKTKIFFRINNDLIFEGSNIKKLANHLKYGIMNAVKGKNSKVFKEKALIICTSVDKFLRKRQEVALEEYDKIFTKLNKALSLLEKSKEETLITSCKHNIEYVKICYNKKLYKEAYIENEKACEIYRNKDYKGAYELFKKVLDKYTKLGDEERIKITTKNKDLSYYNWQTTIADNYVRSALDDISSENFASAFSSLGSAFDIYSKIGNKKGLDNCTKKIEYATQKKQEMIERENRLGEQYRREGNRYYNKGDYEEAINRYQYAAKKFHNAENYSSENSCKEDLDDCYYALGNKYLRWANGYTDEGNFDSAEAYYKKAEDTYCMGSQNRGLNNCIEQKEKSFVKHGNKLYNEGIDEYNNDRFNSARECFVSAKYYYNKGNSTSDVYDCNDMIDKIDDYVRECARIDEENRRIDEYNRGVSDFNNGVDMWNNGNYSGAKSAFTSASSQGVDGYDCNEAIKGVEEEMDK